MSDAALAFGVLRDLPTALAVVRRDGVLVLCSRAWTAPGSPVVALVGRTLAVGDSLVAALDARERGGAAGLAALVRAVTRGERVSGEMAVGAGSAETPEGTHRARVVALRHGGEPAAVVTLEPAEAAAGTSEAPRPDAPPEAAPAASGPEAGRPHPDRAAPPPDVPTADPPAAAWIVSPDLCRTEGVSPSYEALFGRPAASLALDPRDFLLAAHPFDRERVRDGLWRQAAGTFDEVFRLAAPVGAADRVRVRAFPVHDLDGTLARVVILATGRGPSDASGDAALGSTDRTIVASAPVGLALLDADGGVLEVNPALIAILGRDRSPLAHVTELLDQADRAPALAALASPADEGRAGRWTSETILRRPHGGSVTVRLQIAPLPGGGGVLVADDVSAPSRMEQQLRQAQRIESVGQLAGGVAHDFNNILTVIRGHTDLLLGGMPSTDPLHQDLAQIRAAADRAAALTGHLLAFSRRNVLRPRVLDLNRILARAEGLLAQTLGDAIELRLVCAPGLGLVRADPTQVEQVLRNLVMNARDAMPGGGRVTIRTFEVDLDHAFVEAHLGSAAGAHVALRIEDDGIGMDADTLGRVFEPFFTTKAPGKGSGLGLAMTYGIVKQSGGYVDVESTPGEGSTFTIYLPRITSLARVSAPEEGEGDPRPSFPDESGPEEHGAPPSGGHAGRRPDAGPPVQPGSAGAAAEGQAPARPAGDSGARRYTILVAEDEPRVRALASRVLEQEGFEVLAAADGTEALMLARGYADAIDLLLTDIDMPGVGGLELAERLQGERPGLRVLFTSGYADDAVVRRGLGARELPFLPKPFSPADLTRSVRVVLGRG